MAMVDEGLERKQILYNLLKSKDRAIVLLYLKTIYEYVTAKEISDATGIDYSNVVGALKGNGKRFKAERALVSTGLAICEETYDGGPNYYKISDKGMRYALFLEEHLQVQPMLDHATKKNLA